MQLYQMNRDNWFQYEKIFLKLHNKKMFERGGLFRYVWRNPSDWIHGETVLVTDMETCVSFISENEYFERPFLKASGVYGLYGTYVIPSERGKGKASEMAIQTAKIILNNKVAILNNNAKYLAKHFTNSVITG